MAVVVDHGRGSLILRSRVPPYRAASSSPTAAPTPQPVKQRRACLRADGLAAGSAGRLPPGAVQGGACAGDRSRERERAEQRDTRERAPPGSTCTYGSDSICSCGHVFHFFSKPSAPCSEPLALSLPPRALMCGPSADRMCPQQYPRPSTTCGQNEQDCRLRRRICGASWRQHAVRKQHPSGCQRWAAIRRRRWHPRQLQRGRAPISGRRGTVRREAHTVALPGWPSGTERLR